MAQRRRNWPGNKISFQDVVCNTFNTELLSFLFTKWQTQETERSHGKQEFKTRFCFNYFPCDGVTNTQATCSQAFISTF